MRRSVAGHIIRLLRLTAHTRMPFIIAPKTWLLRFVCAAMMEASLTDHQYLPTRVNAVDCMDMLKLRPTEPFICPTTVVAARARSLFQKITALHGAYVRATPQS